MVNLYLALVHSPVYNKNMDVITSSVTNLDIHDIARCAMTYDVRTYYVVHPSPAQQDLARRVISFWQEGAGAEYNPDRREAFDRVKLVSTLGDVREHILLDLANCAADRGKLLSVHSLSVHGLSDHEQKDGTEAQAGSKPASKSTKIIWQVATDARTYPNTITYEDLRSRIEACDATATEAAYLLVFGTGSGIVSEEIEKSDFILQPIYGAGDYNHLSVRSAVAIILDRLRGR
jgi:hypothetical protein